MVLLGVILVLLAAAAGVVLIVGTAQLEDTVQIDVLGGTLSIPPLTLLVTGMVVISVFWLGWALLRSSLRRSKRRRIEAKEASAAAEASRAQERRAAKAAGKTRTKPVKTRRGDPTSVVILEGGNSGETVSLAAAPLLIGRGNDAAIRLDDDYVSTRHARIASSGEQWYVEDLGSTNGTYVGNSRITQATAISLGTQIRIGKTILELRK